MTTNARKKWLDEMHVLTSRAHGELCAAAVVKYAANPRTALHAQFTWDNSVAGHQYRLWEARQLISVAVMFSPHTEKEYRVFVSLAADRRKKDGGYRLLVDVLGSASLRQQLLTEALAELERWQERYERLQELAPIFAANRQVREALAQESVAAC